MKNVIETKENNEVDKLYKENEKILFMFSNWDNIVVPIDVVALSTIWSQI